MSRYERESMEEGAGADITTPLMPRMSTIEEANEHARAVEAEERGVEANLKGEGEAEESGAAQVVYSFIATLQAAEILYGLAVSYLLKDHFKLSPGGVAMIMGILGLPWTLKPLWAFLAETFPLFGYRRKSWIFLSSAGCVASLVACGCFGATRNLWALVSMLLLYSLGAAMSNVMGEGLVVEVGRAHKEGEETARTVSHFFIIRQISFLSAAYLSGLLLERLPREALFLLGLPLPVGVLISVLFLHEEVEEEEEEDEEEEADAEAPRLASLSPSSATANVGFKRGRECVGKREKEVEEPEPEQAEEEDGETTPLAGNRQKATLTHAQEPLARGSKSKKAAQWERVKLLFKTLSTPRIQSAILFVFVLQCTPSYGTAMFYFLTDTLKMHPEMLGRIALVSSAAGLVGLLCYRNFFIQTPLRQLLLWSTIFATPFALLPIVLVMRWNLTIGLPDSLFVMSDNAVMDFLAQLQSMPILVLAAKLCPKGLESSVYSTLLAAYNAGGLVSPELSALLMSGLGVTAKDLSRLPLLIGICVATNIIPLSLLHLMPEPDREKEGQQEGERRKSCRSAFTQTGEEGDFSSPSRATKMDLCGSIDSESERDVEEDAEDGQKNNKTARFSPSVPPPMYAETAVHSRETMDGEGGVFFDAETQTEGGEEGQSGAAQPSPFSYSYLGNKKEAEKDGKGSEATRAMSRSTMLLGVSGSWDPGVSQLSSSGHE
uniref:Uncharacterized protein n=1 Tax=Chromera velia CCMP2878 TaxID=1169474 RepID=A0A0G4GGR9_9ALVE|eukprot:Cvel_21828.t1-p1 / transcript=Cvel_21828.t1 / gene=Cvel_21828 / organism=Chromera_velia_CCMP2878 / gene_product=Folate-biopterin transporter 1, chloroplastic, putative / transcript_product=Folate-biopterin transporter 1, chloroplastic, putative / location=Cvel_scaffold2083:15088-21843(-) / protein_length=718 / sequence_SO=supercontig / SO=protein_coding / is_pseudo=false